VWGKRDILFKVLFYSLPDRTKITIKISARVGEASAEALSGHNLCCLKSETMFPRLLGEHGCMQKENWVRR